jgi:hypothetical protein
VKYTFHATKLDFQKRREKKKPIRERRTVGWKIAEELAREAFGTISQKGRLREGTTKNPPLFGSRLFCDDLSIMPQINAKGKKTEILLGPLTRPSRPRCRHRPFPTNVNIPSSRSLISIFLFTIPASIRETTTSASFTVSSDAS